MLVIASFQPKSKGQYIVEVTQDGSMVKGSPFKLDVTDANVSNASQVKATGAITEGKANTWNEILLDISHAGKWLTGRTPDGVTVRDKNTTLAGSLLWLETIFLELW